MEVQINKVYNVFVRTEMDGTKKRIPTVYQCLCYDIIDGVPYFVDVETSELKTFPEDISFEMNDEELEDRLEDELEEDEDELAPGPKAAPATAPKAALKAPAPAGPAKAPAATAPGQAKAPAPTSPGPAKAAPAPGQAKAPGQAPAPTAGPAGPAKAALKAAPKEQSHYVIWNDLPKTHISTDPKMCPITGQNSGGVYVVMTHNGKDYLLMVHHKSKSRGWEVPWGEYDPKHKDILGTAMTELYEETCLLRLPRNILESSPYNMFGGFAVHVSMNMNLQQKFKENKKILTDKKYHEMDDIRFFDLNKLVAAFITNKKTPTINGQTLNPWLSHALYPPSDTFINAALKQPAVPLKLTNQDGLHIYSN